MQNQWKTITAWLDLEPARQVKASYALVVVALVSVIIYYERKLTTELILHKKELKEKEVEKNEIIVKYLNYIEKREEEYREIVLDIKKLQKK